MRSYKYQQSSGKRKRDKKIISPFHILVLISFLALIIYVFVRFFFLQGVEKNTEFEGVFLDNNISIEENRLEEGEVEETNLEGINGETGIARRALEGETFSHIIVAELPQIDSTSHYYEGWLVKPGITGFFSTGELVERQDGKWGLIFELDLITFDEDISDFSQIVVTKEVRDNNAAPSGQHVLSGEFY